MQEIAFTLKYRSVETVQASRYVFISSRRSIANLKVSSMNWALLQGEQDISTAKELFVLSLNGVDSTR
jgi:hypothetical protein